MARGLDGHDVRELGEDLVEHGAVVLAIRILVEMQLDQVAHLERLPGHRVAVELLQVRDDGAAPRGRD